MKRFIKSIDFLKPKVNLGHKGDLFNYSVFSGIVSICYIIIVIASIVYFAKPLVKREKPTTNIYDAFTNENYTFALNSSYFGHFITLLNNSYEFPDFNFFEYFQIIGGLFALEEYEYYKAYGKIVENDHWVYGPCDDSDYSIKDETIHSYFEFSFCIKKYYDSRKKVYYDKKDSNFKYPILASKRDSSDENVNHFCIIMEKCEQSILDIMAGEGHQCKNESEIEDFIDEQGIKIIFSFLEYDINLYDYSNPESSFWETISTNLNSFNYLSAMKVKINPVIIKTFKGVIFNKVDKKLLYDFFDDEIFTLPKGSQNSYIYGNIFIEFNKKMRFYERRYKKLQDIISQIGGFLKISSSIAHFIVKYFNELKVLGDIRDLISHYYIKENKKKLKDSNNMNETKEILQNDKEMKDISVTEENKKNLLTNNTINNEIKEIKKDINININNEMNRDHNYNEKNIGNIPKDSIQTKINENEVNEELEEKSIFTEENKQFNFFSYVAHKYTLKKTFKKYKIYNDFISKVFSDEQMIKNHLVLYNLTHGRNPDAKIYSLSELLEKDQDVIKK